MKRTVGISDMKVSTQAQDTIVTYSLGSCIGLALYDPIARVGGIVHCMLPEASLDQERARAIPQMFTDTGVVALIDAVVDAGASRQNLQAKVAGAARMLDNGNTFNIGERNQVVLRQVLRENNIPITGEETGGSVARTMMLHIETGKTILRSGGKEYEL